MPIRNRSSMLKQALLSAFGQGDVHLEVIVDDEGCPDDTPQSRTGLADASWSCATTPLGPAAARKAAIKRGGGE